MEFKEFLKIGSESYSDTDVAMIYYHQQNMGVREIASKTGRSIGEVYRIIRHFGNPNRIHDNRHNVMAFSGSGLSVQKIAELTGYTTRNVRYILKNQGISE